MPIPDSATEEISRISNTYENVPQVTDMHAHGFLVGGKIRMFGAHITHVQVKGRALFLSSCSS